MTRLLDCQDEHRKPADLLDGRAVYVWDENAEPHAVRPWPLPVRLAILVLASLAAWGIIVAVFVEFA